MKKNKTEDKAKKTEKELLREQQERLFKLAREIRKEGERKERRHRIASAISYWGPYFIGVLWLVTAVLGALTKTEDWMSANIIGSIWILIGVVSSK